MKKTIEKADAIDMSAVVDTVTSYADGFERVQADLGLNRHALAELLLDHNVEQCPSCRCWVASYERIGPLTQEPDDWCENCRPIEARNED